MIHLSSIILSKSQKGQLVIALCIMRLYLSCVGLIFICNFLDSKKDLPERWFEILLGTFRPPEDDAGAGATSV